jgi:hypothetical protein
MTTIKGPGFEYDDAQVRRAVVKAMPRIRRSLLVAVSVTTLRMTRWVVTRKLLGQYLNRRTGNAIRSINASPSWWPTEDGAAGSFGSNLEYVKAHEQGFQGTVQVKAYERRLFRYRSARSGARLKRRKRVEGAMVEVRAHPREVNIRARHFFRDTLKEQKPAFEVRLRKAILVATRLGRVATPADLESTFGG